MQPLKLATSNLIHNLGLGLAYQKTTFRTKIGGGLGQGSIEKIWDPLCIFATVKASNFKFGTQIGFGTSLPKTTFRTKISGGMGWGSTQKNSDPLRISATVENSNFKFGIQLGFGTIL